jgi:hypothetical protein
MNLLRYIGITTDFERIFFKREFNALAGRHYAGILLLSLILASTLVALGYAVGGLQLLDKRMNNPYTNWVDVIVKNEDREKVEGIRQYFATENALSTFDIRSVTGHIVMLDPLFTHVKEGNSIELKGRTIEVTDAILETILNPADGNWISGLIYNGKTIPEFSSPLGILVTRDMLIKLGYSDPGKQRQILAAVNGVRFLVPIEAIVEELPNHCDYCFKPEFFNLYTSNYLETRFLTVERGSVNQLEFISTNPDSVSVEKWWNDKWGESGLAYIEKTPLVMNEAAAHYRYKLTLHQYPTAAVLDTMFQQFKQRENAKGDLCEMVETPNNAAATAVLSNPHYLAFHFRQLDQVDEFKAFMSSRFGFEINMAHIEDKKNFAIVSDLTWLMAILLFAFSLISIVFFVDNLLRAHIQKIKSNLGTFMAFGWSNALLRSAYLRIVAIYISICIGGAVLVVLVYHCIVQQVMEMSNFNLLDWRVAAALAILMLAGWVKSGMTLHNILKNTPGDLIYDREQY